MKTLYGACFVLLLNTAIAQDSIKNYSQRKTVVWSANTITPVAVHYALYKAWYSNYPKTRFHFVNDGGDWNHMDKAGHLFSGYFLAVQSSRSFMWAGYNEKKSALFGSAASLLFQSAIEYFDGHSQAWGASKGDMIANLAGTVAGGAQQYFWGKVKLPLLITFQKSEFSKYRPEVLGENLPQRLLKDYNAQTYWINIFPDFWLPQKSKWPKWLGFSVGYGSDGMLGAKSNIWATEGLMYDYSHIQRKRQWYFSPALGFSHIKSRRAIVQVLLSATNHIKFPLPAIIFNKPGNPDIKWIFW